MPFIKKLHFSEKITEIQIRIFQAFLNLLLEHPVSQKIGK